MICQERQTCSAAPVGGASVAEILLHALVRLRSGSAASILSFRIDLVSLSFDASTLLLDAFVHSRRIPSEKRHQQASHDPDVQPIAGEENGDHGWLFGIA